MSSCAQSEVPLLLNLIERLRITLKLPVSNSRQLLVCRRRSALAGASPIRGDTLRPGTC